MTIVQTGGMLDQAATGDAIKAAINELDWFNTQETNVDVAPVAKNPLAWDVTFAIPTGDQPAQGNYGEMSIEDGNRPAGATEVQVKTKQQGAKHETEKITIGDYKATAKAIEEKLNNAIVKGKATVRRENDPGTTVKYAVAFDSAIDVEPLEILDPSAGLTGATVATLHDGSSEVHTQLTVEKQYSLLNGILGNSNIAEIWERYRGTISYDKIVITHVDANTTIVGGSNENNFKIIGNATYEGTLTGQKKSRPLTSFLDFSSLTDAVAALDIPNLNTINTLDLSDGNATQPTFTNLTHLLTNGAVEAYRCLRRSGWPGSTAIGHAHSRRRHRHLEWSERRRADFTTQPIVLEDVVGADIDMSAAGVNDKYQLTLQPIHGAPVVSPLSHLMAFAT